MFLDRVPVEVAVVVEALVGAVCCSQLDDVSCWEKVVESLVDKF